MVKIRKFIVQGKKDEKALREQKIKTLNPFGQKDLFNVTVAPTLKYAEMDQEAQRLAISECTLQETGSKLSDAKLQAIRNFFTHTCWIRPEDVREGQHVTWLELYCLFLLHTPKDLHMKIRANAVRRLGKRLAIRFCRIRPQGGVHWWLGKALAKITCKLRPQG